MTPDLWNYIDYNWKKEALGGSVAPDAMVLIGSHLRRADGRPLRMRLWLSPDERPLGIANVFQEFSQTITKLSLGASKAVFQALATDRRKEENSETRFPNLKLLHLFIPYHSNEDWGRRLAEKVIELSGCDRLENITLSSADKSFGFIQNGILSGIPWFQLTMLIIREQRLSPLLALEIMSSCLRLEWCMLAMQPWEGDVPLPHSTSHAILSNLGKLELEFMGNWRDGQFSLFLDALTLPQLYLLLIKAHSCTDILMVDALAHLQDRSRAPIKVLYLAGMYLPFMRLPNLLQRMPLLKKLNLRSPHDNRYHGYYVLLELCYQISALSELVSLEICDNMHELMHLLGGSQVPDTRKLEAFVFLYVQTILIRLARGSMGKLEEVNLGCRNFPSHLHSRVEQVGNDVRAKIYADRGIRVKLIASN
ncbi:hypothetical protein H0H92_004950 [Tricholoma furcatifolium]|nr:hypothetical protein H0H92_004950 [Tricholoma furcatifolium]